MRLGCRGRKGKDGLKALLEIRQFVIIRAGALPCAHREFLWAKALCRAWRERAKREALGSAPHTCGHRRVPALPTLLAPLDAAETRRSRGSPATSRLSSLMTHRTGAPVSYSLLNLAGRQSAPCNSSAAINVQRALGQTLSGWRFPCSCLPKTLATHIYQEINDLSLSASSKTQISDAQKHGADDVSKPMLTLT